MTIIDTGDFSRREAALSMKRDLRLIKGDYNEILDAAETDGQQEDYLKIELLDEYAHVEILNTLRNYYPNLLSLVGKQLHNAETSLSVETGIKSSTWGYHDDVLPGIYGGRTQRDADGMVSEGG